MQVDSLPAEPPRKPKKRSKGKEEKERYTHLNAEFQKISRRDKKAFLSEQCRIIEENSRTAKSHLMKVKDESEKTSLNLNIQKTKIMTSGPITSWQKDGETMETVTDFIFLGSKITADDKCSHEIKSLLLGRKAITNLDSILRSRDITLPTKVHLVKAMVFPVVM